MLVIGIILLVIALVGAYIYAMLSKSKFSLIVVLLVSIAIIGGLLLASEIQEKETAIECLKGNNPYKMEIRYELQDSIYVPVDTIYIKLYTNRNRR